MKYIINLVSGSFLRTLGRIFAYIAIGAAIAYFGGFFSIAKVNALTNTGLFEGLYVDDNGRFYNMNGNSLGTDLGYSKEPISLYDENLGLNTSFYGYRNENYVSLQNYGYALSQCGFSFIQDYYYSFTYYFYSLSNNYIYPWYSDSTYKIGIHSTYNPDWGMTLNTNEISRTTDARVSELSINYVHSFSFVVKAPSNGSCIALVLDTGGNAMTDAWDYYFVGLEYESLGSKAPSTSEITNALNSSFDNINSNIVNAQNYINSNINNAANSINDNIDEMTDKVDNSLNSESDDTTSKSCGVICKLKGIFTGIIELPSKIVNLLIDALKSLFVPTDAQLYEIINDSKELSENFGFVGESVNFFIDIFTSLLGMVNGNGCIELPELTIGSTSLFDSFTFWKAQQVCLADNDILANNIDTIRTITSIVLVGLFIGFASRQFFGILSKNSSGESYSEGADGSVLHTEWSVVNGKRYSNTNRW